MADSLIASHPLVIFAGDDRPLVWTLSDSTTGAPVNLAGYSARAQVRDRADSETVLHEWSTEADPATATLSTDDSTVSLLVTDSDTWTWTSGVYDLIIIDFAGRREIVDRGLVVVVPGVTR